MVLNFYKNLFREENVVRLKLLIVLNFPLMDDSTKFNLLTIPRLEEIKQAIFAIGATKASRVDGFLALLFQRNWPIVIINVVSLVQEVFKGIRNLEKVNKTLIV